MSSKPIALTLLALVILVDGNYPGHEAFTEQLYLMLCAPLIGATLMEMIAYLLVGAAALDMLNSGSPVYRGDAFKVLVRIAVAPLAVGALMTVYGLVRNNGQLQIAVWQTRSFPMMFSWALIWFYLCRSLRDFRQLLDVVSAAVFVKALHSLTIYFVEMGGSMRGEWLTSHEASLFMGISLVYLGTRLVAWPGAAQKVMLLVPIGVITLHWIVNDRRVSFLGVMFSFVFAVSFLYKVMRLWHVAAAICMAFLFVAQQVVTWESPDNWLRGIVEPSTDSSSDYREIENFDLYVQVGSHPFAGVGFGNPFETPIPLPNIVQIASLLAWVPHNSLLMIWSMAGPLGVAAVGLFISFGIAAFVRLFHASREIEMRTMAFVGFSAVVQWTLYAWADMGLASSIMCLLPACLTGAGLKLLHLRRAA